jgi:hypothetical protein
MLVAGIQLSSAAALAQSSATWRDSPARAGANVGSIAVSAAELIASRRSTTEVAINR